MQLDMKANAYSISYLGYYDGTSVADQFPDFSSVIKSYVEWGQNVTSIANTQTYEASFATTFSKTYFADAYYDAAKNEAVVVLWKEVKNNKGDIYALSKNRKPGNGKVKKNSFGADVIPGFPVYFWFRPSEDKIIPLLFDHSEKGKTNLENHLLGFLRFKAKKWSVTEIVTDPNGLDIVKDHFGFAHDGKKENIVKDLQPRASFSIIKSGNALQTLLDNQASISRLQRVERITTSKQGDVDVSGIEYLYNRFFSDLKDDLTTPTSVRYKSEVPWKPTREEIEEVYANAMEAFEEEQLMALTAITKQQKRLSFLGNADKRDLRLWVSGAENGFIPASALYDALDKARANLL